MGEDGHGVAASWQARYDVLAGHLADTVTFVYDRDHRVVSASGLPLRPRGFEPGDLIGRRPADLLEADQAVLLDGFLDDALGGRSTTAELRSAASGILSRVDVSPLASEEGEAVEEVMVVATDVGVLKRQERAVATSESRWRTLFDEAPVAMVELARSGQVVRANQAMAAFVDHPLDDLLGSDITGLVHPDERADAEAGFAALAAGGPAGERVRRRFVTRLGEDRWANVRGSLVPGAEGGDGGILLHVVDVTADSLAREQLATMARFSALVEHSFDAITVSSASGTVLYANPAIEGLTGVSSQDLIGRQLSGVFHPDDLGVVRDTFGRLLAEPGGTATCECRILHQAGGWRHAEVNASNRLHDPAIGGLVANARDITERVEAAAHLAHRAMHDTLTDLPNRALLIDRLDQALARARRSGRLCAVLFLDLDRFKQINDTLGHAAGDALLVATAERLRSIVRPGDSVARLGGDEFVVLAENIDAAATALAIAERIRVAVNEPVTVVDQPITISCSVGVALSERHSPEALVQEADLALYRAKESGRNRWELYDQAMRHQAKRRFDTEDLVRKAIHLGWLEVHYQPIVDLATGRTVATEALARIRRDDGVLVGPDEFIGVAEESGLIIPFGTAVLATACAQQAEWIRLGVSDGHVAVNVSARQLATTTFVEDLGASLTAAGLEPSALCLELTETALIETGGSISNRLDEVRSLGICLALDDFGTGWSSLAYLRRFPIDIIKIDRSFVGGLGSDDGDAELVKAIVGLSRALGLTTVAEGVETVAQHEMLEQLGCDRAQGYLYSPPRPAGAGVTPADARPAGGSAADPSGL